MGISKRGDKNLRRLLVQCARVYLQRLEHQRGALANKLARIAWSIAANHTQFEAGPDALAV